MNNRIGYLFCCLFLSLALVAFSQPAAWGALESVNVTVGDAPLIRPGLSHQPIASIFITEKTPGALEAGNRISLKLPGDSSWDQVPEAHVLQGDILLEDGQIVADSQGASVSYLILKASSTPADIEFAAGSISLEAGAIPGSLIATIVSISNEGESTIDCAVTVQDRVLPQVLAGLQDQPAADITIEESAPGSIMAHPHTIDGHLYIILPEGVSFSQVPELSVEGELKIDSANSRLTTNGLGADNTLDIPVLASSQSAPSLIKISNVLLTLDRTVPRGTVTAVIRGSAVDAFSSQTAANDPALYERNVATFNIAECVDELAEETSGPTIHKAIFTLGQAEYTSQGISCAMESIPYVSGNRVLLPYRYLAIVLGIPDDAEHISWDQASQSVILTTPVGDIISNTLGSPVLTVNGQDIQMEAASEQLDGHVFLPARWLTEALGGLAEWVPEHQQVWISIQY